MQLITTTVNNQPDNPISYICLLQFYTCFEKPSADHQESQLYQYDLWYMSLCVGGRAVCRVQTCIPHGHLHTVTYTAGRIDTIDCPDDQHLGVRNM